MFSLRGRARVPGTVCVLARRGCPPGVGGGVYEGRDRATGAPLGPALDRAGDGFDLAQLLGLLLSEGAVCQLTLDDPQP